MKLTSKILSIFLFVFGLNLVSNAQELKADAEMDNATAKIKDGSIVIKVMGGKAPYRYYWSEKGISLYESKASGLAEGSEIKCMVKDASGDSIEVVKTIPAESFAEKMNAEMVPVVNGVSSVFFWDPLAAMGIYDPVVYINEQTISTPLVKDTSIRHMYVSNFLVDEGASVKHDQAIAEIMADGKLMHLYAIGDGNVSFKVALNDSLKDSNGKGKEIAKMTYSEPYALLTANGTKEEKGIPLVVIWLVIGAIIFTIKMNFINFRGVKHAIELVQGKFDDPNDKGEVSHFQALTTALSGTVGLGNIAGVAVAISLGGAGATFWMILAGLMGMASKFVECTLGVKYREIDADDGEVHGGPMYYLSKGLAKKNMAGLGKVLAGIFAVLCIGGSFGGGNMFQANQAFQQFSNAIGGWDGGGPIFGVIVALLVGVVIIGGIKSIAKVTDKIVPLMVGIYVFFALLIIFMNFGNIGTAFSAIFNGAFSPEALKGGVIGVLIVGFQRAAFSNEAGVGSASIAHSAAKTNEPVSEGIVALLEPFIDTVVVCTMTALVLIFTGFAADSQGLEGAELTSAAFSQQFGWFQYVLTIAIILFAFSTMVSWSYYGLKAWTYLFGRTKAMEVTYKVIFCLMVVLGSSVGLGAVLDFSDMMVLGMAFPNILGLVLLSGEVKADMKDYFARIKSGAIKKFK